MRSAEWRRLGMLRMMRGRFARGASAGLRRHLQTQRDVRVSTLGNGLRVVSEATPGHTATVGVWIDAGSAYETPRNNGTAHFLEHITFKGTPRRSQRDIELQIENMGASLNAYTSREHTVYYAKAFKNNVNEAVDIIGDVLLNSTLSEAAIERERGTILREMEEVNNIYEEAIFDHLHAAAFQETPLGMTILGPEANINAIKRNDLQDYISTHYTAGRMVLVGTGAVDHDALVRQAESVFASLKPTPSGDYRGSKAAFTGSQITIYNQDMHDLHVAIAVPSVGWSHPDYFTFLTMQSLVGNFDINTGVTPPSRLGEIVARENLGTRLSSFSTFYHQTGLFGAYAIGNPHSIPDLVYEICNEWQRLGHQIGDRELERAKNQVKASLLLQLDGTAQRAEDIGRQFITLNRRISPEEVSARIDAISAKDIKRLVADYFHDVCPAVVAIGDLHEFPDYNQIRSWMYWNRL
jgi:processing peptidase subunit beta